MDDLMRQLMRRAQVGADEAWLRKCLAEGSNVNFIDDDTAGSPSLGEEAGRSRRKNNSRKMESRKRISCAAPQHCHCFQRGEEKTPLSGRGV
ncbi:hypothetical protein GDO81_018597 [Engystomops pustulosus]|uniref:Uncharacterized protein n=1 Tax=Engystomops pustulosus TaxID=76066 RepID=A0AAV6ZE08_ENGPU|nr:hypothetical protein GDO81_018597 [Engystomops pustulosus]